MLLGVFIIFTSINFVTREVLACLFLLLSLQLVHVKKYIDINVHICSKTNQTALFSFITNIDFSSRNWICDLIIILRFNLKPLIHILSISKKLHIHPKEFYVVLCELTLIISICYLILVCLGK